MNMKFLLLLLFTIAHAYCSENLVILDLRLLIKESDTKYEDLEHYKIRRNRRRSYVYMPDSSRQLLSYIQSLPNTKLMLVNTTFPKQRKIFSKLNISNEYYEILRSKKNKIRLKEIKDYDNIIQLGYSDQGISFTEISRKYKYINISNNKYFHKTVTDAQTKYNALSSSTKRRIGFLYNISNSSKSSLDLYNEQNKTIISKTLEITKSVSNILDLDALSTPNGNWSYFLKGNTSLVNIDRYSFKKPSCFLEYNGKLFAKVSKLEPCLQNSNISYAYFKSYIGYRCIKLANNVILKNPYQYQLTSNRYCTQSYKDLKWNLENKEPFCFLESNGKIINKYDYDFCEGKAHSHLNFKEDKELILGCERKTLEGETIKSYPIKHCLNKLDIKIKWNLKDNNLAQSCNIISKNGAKLQNTQLSECIKYDKDNLKHSFIYNKSKDTIKECAITHKDGFKIDSQEVCSSKLLLMKDNNNTVITGCFKVDPKTGIKYKKVDLNTCNINRSNYTLKLNHIKKEVLGCYLADEKSSLPIEGEQVSIDKCLSDKNTTYAFDKSKSMCKLFVKAKDSGLLYKLKEVKIEQCDDDKVISFDKQTNLFYRNDLSESYSNKLRRLTSLFVTNFKNIVFSTSRDTMFYNYRKRSLISGNNLKIPSRGKLNTTSKIAIDYANEWMSTFYKYTPNEKGMVGWGLYLSNNPVESQDYGNTLLSIKLPKSSLILDLRSMHKGFIPLSKEAYSIVKNECGLTDSISSYRYHIPANRTVNNYIQILKNQLTGCKLAHYALTSSLIYLNVNAIAYDWNYNSNFLNYTRNKICDPETTNATIVLINAKLNPDTVKLIVPEGVSNPNKVDNDTHNYLNAMIAQYTRKRYSEHNRDISLIPLSETAEYIHWRNSSQLGCHKDYMDQDFIRRFP